MKLLLVDGSAVLHRAYHAYPPLTAKDGKLVGTVYGVASILISALQELGPSEVVVAWDVPKPTFRHSRYIGYKAKRRKADPEMIEQIPLTKQVINQMGLTQVEKEGYEADDIIGTLAKQGSSKGEVVILTGDQDTMQLVNKQVKVMMPPRGKEPAMLYGTDEVVARYGVRPDQIVDYKALVGDSSDNIPGVNGIGARGASQLLQKYKTLEGIYAHIEEIPDKVRGKLSEGKESAELSQELATIVCNVPLGENIKTEYTGLDKEELKESLLELGFKSLVRRVWPELEETKKKKIPDNQMGLF